MESLNQVFVVGRVPLKDSNSDLTSLEGKGLSFHSNAFAEKGIVAAGVADKGPDTHWSAPVSAVPGSAEISRSTLSPFRESHRFIPDFEGIEPFDFNGEIVDKAGPSLTG